MTADGSSAAEHANGGVNAAAGATARVASPAGSGAEPIRRRIAPSRVALIGVACAVIALAIVLVLAGGPRHHNSKARIANASASSPAQSLTDSSTCSDWVAASTSEQVRYAGSLTSSPHDAGALAFLINHVCQQVAQYGSGDSSTNSLGALASTYNVAALLAAANNCDSSVQYYVAAYCTGIPPQGGGAGAIGPSTTSQATSSSQKSGSGPSSSQCGRGQATTYNGEKATFAYSATGVACDAALTVLQTAYAGRGSYPTGLAGGEQFGSWACFGGRVGDPYLWRCVSHGNVVIAKSSSASTSATSSVASPTTSGTSAALNYCGPSYSPQFITASGLACSVAKSVQASFATACEHKAPNAFNGRVNNLKGVCDLTVMGFVCRPLGTTYGRITCIEGDRKVTFALNI